jgi:hypothetical protein
LRALVYAGRPLHEGVVRREAEGSEEGDGIDGLG